MKRKEKDLNFSSRGDRQLEFIECRLLKHHRGDKSPFRYSRAPKFKIVSFQYYSRGGKTLYSKSEWKFTKYNNFDRNMGLLFWAFRGPS